MASERYFNQARVTGFTSSGSESDGIDEDDRSYERRDTIGLAGHPAYPITMVMNGEDVVLCEDFGDLSIIETSGDGEEAKPYGWDSSTPPEVGVEGVVAAPVVNDDTVDQPSRVVELADAGVRAAPGSESDSGYETMNVDSNQAREEVEEPEGTAVEPYETMNVNSNQAREEVEESEGTEVDPKMDTSETDGGATIGSGFNNINFYCVCCSKQVESTADMQNRLCKECVSIMDGDEANDSTPDVLCVPCASCSKPYKKSRIQRNPLCRSCTAIVLHGPENELGVSKILVLCMVCRRPFTQPAHKLGDTVCLQCHYVMKAPPVYRYGAESLLNENNPRWSDTIALQAYAAIAVKTYMRKHFYKWCDGHRNDNQAQEAHQCLEKSYAEDTLRRLCYMICPVNVVKMIKSLSVRTDVRVGVGAERVVGKAIWSIYLAADPVLKMEELVRGCPRCIRTHIEKTVGKWGNRLYLCRYRDQFLMTPRKLYYQSSP